MEQQINITPEIIHAIIDADGKSAICDDLPDRGKKYRIQEIMLGAGPMRKCLPWSDKFLKENTEYRAEILKNGKLRII